MYSLPDVMMCESKIKASIKRSVDGFEPFLLVKVPSPFYFKSDLFFFFFFCIKKERRRGRDKQRQSGVLNDTHKESEQWEKDKRTERKAHREKAAERFFFHLMMKKKNKLLFFIVFYVHF